MKNLDDKSYRRFTTKLELDKFMHSLDGFLKGIAMDGILNIDEVNVLENLVDECQELKNWHPYNEIIPELLCALKNGVFSKDSQENILFISRNFSIESKYFKAITSDMQKLHGIMSGISADKEINESELRSLANWLNDRVELQGSWPYDEIRSLINGVLQDGTIDQQEHDMLLNFFSEFQSNRQTQEAQPASKGTIQGVCATNPKIDFLGKKFCVTGESTVAPRSEIAQLIIDRGGLFSENVVRDVDYLVVGADGNPCWAFSCYGRKIEKAVVLRKKGMKILIVHENAFWAEINATPQLG